MLKKKRLFSLGALALSVALITGCGNDQDVEEDQTPPAEQETPAPEDEEQPSDQDQDQEADEDNNDSSSESGKSLNAEEELQEKIAADAGIENVMVQVVEGDGDRVNADIEINDEQELSAEEVAEKYSKVIKEKYPDHLVDIIIVQDGNQIAQETYE